MSSKDFGQIRHRNKRGFPVSNTFFSSFKQPLKSGCASYTEAYILFDSFTPCPDITALTIVYISQRLIIQRFVIAIIIVKLNVLHIG